LCGIHDRESREHIRQEVSGGLTGETGGCPEMQFVM